MSRQCPASGCPRTVPDKNLMCRKHWHMVPKTIQRSVWVAWGDGLGEGSLAHTQAITTAISAVNRKLQGQP